MRAGNDGAAIRQLRTLFHLGTIRELTDGQLLERFATGGGEAAELAFAALVERHGPMVLRVCRGVLADPHEAQDAFQATFLVLVRKARGLWVRDSLGPWLHQVAHRTASCARVRAARRRRHERQAATIPRGSPPGPGEELGRVLHAEINRLPERDRAVVVLCDLEGQTHEQAARHLGWPVGTVKSRLSRARDRLRDRLRRRGLAPGAGLMLAGPRLELPADLAVSTTGAAVRFVTARALARGSAASLAREVLRTMAITRGLKLATALLLVGSMTTGFGWLAAGELPGDEPVAAAEPAPARAGDEGVTAVEPGPLRVTVNERGGLEASRVEDIQCEVEGQATIIFILPEGTRVTKGQKVCELDSATLRDRLQTQRIATTQAEAAYKHARLTREVAEIAIREYIEGTLKQDQGRLKAEVDAAQAAIRAAESRLERLRRARQRLNGALSRQEGGETPSAIMADIDIDDRLASTERDLARGKAEKQRAEGRQVVLERFTRERTTRELEVEIERARVDELAKKQAWELAKSVERKLERQIESCVITTPIDGMIVYADDPRRTDRGSQIEEGSTVRERQLLFKVVDLDNPMRVNTKVHEAIVDQVQPGQTARIHVDAFPEKDLVGRVISVAPRPDPSSSFRETPPRKVYTTLVQIEGGPQILRPGMTAAVEILIAEKEGILRVPISAVLPREGRRRPVVWGRVAVQAPGGGFEWREVTLGMSDGKLVEIKEGLRSGERVADDAAAVLEKEGKRQPNESGDRLP